MYAHANTNAICLVTNLYCIQLYVYEYPSKDVVMCKNNQVTLTARQVSLLNSPPTRKTPIVFKYTCKFVSLLLRDRLVSFRTAQLPHDITGVALQVFSHFLLISIIGRKENQYLLFDGVNSYL